MEEVCERANLKEALRQVRGNKGSAGVDRMTVDQLGGYLKQHWPAIREQLLNGTYEPKPVRRVEIPKPDGGVLRIATKLINRDPVDACATFVAPYLPQCFLQVCSLTYFLP